MTNYNVELDHGSVRLGSSNFNYGTTLWRWSEKDHMWKGKRYNWRPLRVQDSQWLLRMILDDDAKIKYVDLPHHYQHQKLVAELPFRTADVICWIWTLAQLKFPIGLQFKILYILLRFSL